LLADANTTWASDVGALRRPLLATTSRPASDPTAHGMEPSARSIVFGKMAATQTTCTFGQSEVMIDPAWPSG
jgi:hypothetical protein